ncbi:hypothetical protein EF909_34610 [Streptomyces sp. WAC01280]|nr:hypothetical protein EF909_34610 [Streptomyces sp. WAC01280]
MVNPIARLLGLVLRLLLPPSGRRRLGGPLPRPVPLAHPSVAPTAPPRRRVPLLRGEDSRLVRPYLDEVRSQRRRALWLAVHGVDVGARSIHGVEVA